MNKDNIDKPNKNKQPHVWGGAAERGVRGGGGGEAECGNAAPEPGGARLGKDAGLNLASREIRTRSRKARSRPRMFAALPVELVPLSRTELRRGTHTHQPTQAHKTACRPTSERTRRAETMCSGRGARSAPLPYAPLLHFPSPQTPGQPLAGRGGGGAGCRAALAQKAETPGARARSVSAAPSAPWRKPA